MNELSILYQSKYLNILGCWSQFSLGIQLDFEMLGGGLYIGPFTILIGELGEEEEDE